MADFLMPALGADMETGKVVEWLVKPGDRITPGGVIAVVETHKGAIEVECFLDGIVADLAPLNEELPVGAVLAHIRGEGERARAPAASASTRAPATAAKTPPPLARAPAPAGEPAPMVSTAAWSAAGVRTRVSPAARRRAQELGLDADMLTGTGVDGAVTLADVELAAAHPATRPETTPAVAVPRVARRGFDAAQMRQAIAAAMSRSKREIPHYYLTATVDFATAQAWIERYNADREPAERLLPAALLLKATARALLEVPQFNGFYEEGRFRAGAGIHPGWAVALRGGGLIAPAIHDADRKALSELMAALRDLVQRARTGGLRSSELTDPTITVTSLGDRGAETVLGVVYPPQVAIVGFGRILQRPWVTEGQVAVRPLVTLSLAADHRASDGHVGGLLLSAIDAALQSPDQL